ncbi:MAG: ABC transporter substrate-binding protein [Xanthobacteraceae bacterium]
MKISRRAGLKALATGAAAVAMPGIIRAEEQEIVIGAPNSLTGGLGENGQRATAGMQIAIDQVNREGGIKALGGAKLKLVIADTSSENPTQAASVTRRMIDQEKAVVLLGATTSAMTLAAQVEAEKSEIPIVTGSYADGIVTRGYKYTFKITPQGGAVWNWSMSSGYDMWKVSKGSPPKTSLIFMSNDAVGLVVQKQLPEHAKTLNLEVPFSQSFQMGLSDPSVAVAPVLRYKPDMIFLGGFVNDIILIIKALRGVGVTAPIFGAGPAGSDSVGQGLGARGQSLFCADGVELGPRHARQ